MVGLVETKARLRTGSGTTVESAYKPLAFSSGVLDLGAGPHCCAALGDCRRRREVALTASEDPDGAFKTWFGWAY